MIVPLNETIFNKKINKNISIDFIYDWDDEIEYPDGSIFFKTHDVGDELELIDKAIEELEDYDTINDLAIYFYTKVINLDYIEIEGKRITREEVNVPKNAPKYKRINGIKLEIGKVYTDKDIEGWYNTYKDFETEDLLEILDNHKKMDTTDPDMKNHLKVFYTAIKRILEERK